MGIDLSTNDARLALASKYAAKYGLDPAIVCAVCEQESAWNPWALRYEPAFYDRYIAPLITGTKPLDSTEAHARAFSYGLMQVMGQTARELGFARPYLVELCDPDAAVEFGCKKLQECFALHGPDREKALLAYNGGGNPDYSKQVLARVPRYEASQGAD